MTGLRRSKFSYRLLPSSVQFSDRFPAELELVKKSLHPLEVIVGFIGGLLGDLFVSLAGRRRYGFHEPLRSALGLSPSGAQLTTCVNSNPNTTKIFSGLVKILSSEGRFA